jgi:5-methylcytosine-specific restriction endonuclease McrA
MMRACICGRVIPAQWKRCERCADGRPNLRAGATTAQRGYGAAHQRRSRHARALHPFCAECGATEDLTADHVEPLANGGHPLGELRVLCRSCNGRRGAPPRGEGRHRGAEGRFLTPHALRE